MAQSARTEVRRQVSRESLRGSAKAYYLSKARYSPGSRTSNKPGVVEVAARVTQPHHLIGQPSHNRNNSRPTLGTLPSVGASGVTRLPAPFQKRISQYGPLAALDLSSKAGPTTGTTYSSWKSSAIANPAFTKPTVVSNRTRTDWSAK